MDSPKAFESPSITSRFGYELFSQVRNSGQTPTDQQLQTAFEDFKDSDDLIHLGTLREVLVELFTELDKSKYMPLSEDQISQIIRLFSRKGIEALTYEDFTALWKFWLRSELIPATCLLVIDVQNDFVHGKLRIDHCPANQDPKEIVPIINKLRKNNQFDHIAMTLDWHPANHISFHENRFDHFHSKNFSKDVQHDHCHCCPLFGKICLGDETEQVMWPTHCVQGSWGAELVQDLVKEPTDIIVYKGEDPMVDSYSGFFDNSRKNQTKLAAKLEEKGITDLFICGLAYDVCVGSTALHAAELGYRTFLIDDCSKGVSIEGIEAMKERLTKAGVEIISSSQVPQILENSKKRNKHQLASTTFDKALNAGKAKKLHDQVAIANHHSTEIVHDD